MAESLSLSQPIKFLSGVGPARSEQFSRLGIETLEDLLFYIPRDYLDYSKTVDIDQLKKGRYTIRVKLFAPVKTWSKGRRHMTEAVFEDETGKVKAIWFNQRWRQSQLKLDEEYLLSGDFGYFGRGYSFSQPEIELAKSLAMDGGQIVSRYKQTKGLSSKIIRKAQRFTLDRIDRFEIYPPDILKELNLMPLTDALEQIHFPIELGLTEQAKDRLAFDEVFALQLANKQLRRKLKSGKATKVKFDVEYAKKFVKNLDFKLTDPQRVSAWEILKDLDTEVPMNRMLEGDVGSGKTVVATLAAAMVALGGNQTAIVAPTTILADQHYKTIKNLLKPFKLNVVKLTGELKISERNKVQKQLKDGTADIVVGTHAIFSTKAEYKSLVFAVIDEQHRFGVEQRAKLTAKNPTVKPHILTMTATPIPRSLALTLYGELDISIIDQLPKGRKKIETKVFSWASKFNAYEQIKQAVADGNQAYVVVPRIDEVEEDNTASIVSLSKDLQESLLKGIKFGVIHSKLKPKERENVMRKFMDGTFKVLLSTTMVEVGVDVPKATVMLIESAEMFGLAQLHQLRGRVGRSDLESYCLLVCSKDYSPSARLKAMTHTSDGFKLSELDLQLRGPGALYGVRQHGPLELNIADITDTKLVAKAKSAVDLFEEKGYNVSKFPLLNRRVAALSGATFLN